MEVATIKEKLSKSRKLWFNIYSSGFLADLYEVLDVESAVISSCMIIYKKSLDKEDTLTWSDDGKVLLIKDLKKFDEEILPYFNDCNTVQNFLTNVKSFSFT